MVSVGSLQPVTDDITDKELTATAKGCRLAYLLMVRRRMHITEAAAELGCTERHVRRVADAASLGGVPLVVVDGWIELWLEGRDI